MTNQNRRDFLRLAANSAAAAAGLGLFPPGIRKALALPANNTTGTIQDVQHIVILMQENRSFDHYYGTLRGVRGYGDPHPIKLPGGQPVWYQPDGAGYVLPFHPTAKNLGLQFLQDLAHDWTSTHKAWNLGQYNQWVPAKGSTTMAHYTREDIPFHYALADAFTICDNYHCSTMAPTDPNRYYMWTGWVGNDGSGGGPVIDNAEAGYGWSTYPELLEKAGVSWKIYQDIGDGLTAAGSWGDTDDAYIGNYGDNSLLYFHQYQNAQPGNPLYDKARTGTNVANGGGLFDILKQDVAGGTLPQVSWIVAPEAYCEHPNWPPNYGAWYVDQVLEVLTSNPEVWSKTALLITYDENDGFFDHLPPPVAPASSSQGLSTVATTNEYFGGDSSYAAGPYGLGPRVPMTIVSPWTKGGFVCSQLFDHTSIIQFIEKRFGAQYPGISESNVTAWRRAVCGDLSSAFNFETPNDAVPPLPSTAAYLPPDDQRHPSYDPLPPLLQALPKQEPGVRLARALPYALSANGRLDGAAGRFWIDFANTGAAGAAFWVYASNRSDGPWTYTVGAGATLSDYWSAVAVSGGEYELAVYGPNGFLRQFTGNVAVATTSGNPNPEATLANDAGGRGVVLTLTNSGGKICRMIVTSAYGQGIELVYFVQPGASVSDYFDLRDSYGWYDLKVTAEVTDGFVRRFAGHIENGQSSISDPAIGAAKKN
jgi:phospholipase C